MLLALVSTSMHIYNSSHEQYLHRYFEIETLSQKVPDNGLNNEFYFRCKPLLYAD